MHYANMYLELIQSISLDLMHGALRSLQEVQLYTTMYDLPNSASWFFPMYISHPWRVLFLKAIPFIFGDLDAQGRPEKLRGPGQRVKWGPRGKKVSILNHNFTQAVS